MEHHRGHLGDTDWWTSCAQILILQVEGGTQESAHVTHSQRDLSCFWFRDDPLETTVPHQIKIKILP